MWLATTIIGILLLLGGLQGLYAETVNDAWNAIAIFVNVGFTVIGALLVAKYLFKVKVLNKKYM